jgi:DNA polymerase-3 subunit gamma/tau
MGQALYRRYRSKSLSEVIGQEHITETLDKALQSGRISHAYLFTGPRGVGKTSIARILAHEINGLPYTDDSQHIDIIEIDAASNRRIDEIRELREKVYVAPTSAKYKVYIIDEVHMLTKEAFNALLKTLEEPPAHVVFILATTDAHKLPETIVSRTQHFTFKPIEKSKVVAHLRAIADKEGLNVEDDALELLAQHGEGSFRDSISLLDQASSHGKALTLEHAQTLLGVPSAAGIIALLAALGSSQPTAATMQALLNLYDQGYQAALIAKELSLQLRGQLVEGVLQLPPEQTLQLLGSLLEVPLSTNPERYLEIVLLQSLPKQSVSAPPAVVNTEVVVMAPRAAAASVEPVEASGEPIVTEKPVVTAVLQVAAEQPEAITIAPTTDIAKPEVEILAGSAEVNETIWPELLTALKIKYNTLYGVVRMAQPDFSNPKKLTLGFSFAFHQKRIADPKNRQIIADIVTQITGKKIAIECILDKEAKPLKVEVLTPHLRPVAPKEDLSNISNIFGGAELLES